MEWARQRAKVRRTFIDVMKAGKEYGTDRSQWKPRRDAHMVRIGGYSAVIILHRKVETESTRLADIARMADEAGIPVKFFDYDSPQEDRSRT